MTAQYDAILQKLKERHDESAKLKVNDRVLVVDGLNTFIRAYAANPVTTADGIHVGGIVGALKSIGYAIKTLNPTRCIVVFDGQGGSQRRRKIYPEYKKHRKTNIKYNRQEDIYNSEDEKESMKMQVTRLLEYLNFLPVTIVMVDRIEADDTIAYIARSLRKENEKVIIMSSDKDFYQLVSNTVEVWSPTKKKLYREVDVYEEYGVPPHNFIIYRILDGDTSDNIKGINGFGLKTVRKSFPFLKDPKTVSVNELVDYSSQQKGKLFENVSLSKDILERNWQLMQLDDVNISTHAKLIIAEKYNTRPIAMQTNNFLTTFRKDRLDTAMINADRWLSTTFNYLNSFLLRSEEDGESE